MDVVMPQLGETVKEGTVTAWRKKAGERVEKDEPLFEVNTDKVDMDVPSPATGVLSAILVSEGSTVRVGEKLAVIAVEGEAAAPGRVADEPRLSPVVRKLLSEPNRLTFGFEDHRHAVVKRRAQFVRFEDARAVISVALQHGIQRFERRADNPGRAAPSALPKRGPCCWREPPTGSIRRYRGECGFDGR